MIVTELIAVLGAKIEKGDFADVFSLLDKVQEAALNMAGAVDQAIRKSFEIVDRVAEQGDAIAMTSEQFGIAADALQELGYAATLSDSSAEAMTQSLQFLGKAAQAAADGSADAVKAFKGVRLKDANGQIRSADSLLSDLADQFSAMPNGVEKTNRALELFGKSGRGMIGMLNRGSDGIAALRQEARDLGVVMSAQAIASSERYDDSLKRLQSTWDGLAKHFAGPVIEKVATLFEKLRATLTTKGMARAVDMLSTTFGRLVDTLSIFTDVLGWLTSNETVVSGALYLIASALIGLAAWAATAGSALTAAALSAAASWALAALPFLALGALIFLIADELYTFAEGGDTLLGDLIGWFNKIDPEDNEFVRLLKTAGALIFDLTDPGKWKALGQAIVDWVFSPVKALVSSLEWVLNKLGIADKFSGLKVDTSLANVAPAIFGEGGGVAKAFPGLADPLALGDKSFGDSMAEKFPGLLSVYDWTKGPAAMESPQLASTMPAVNKSTSINAPINVSVGPGTDPEAVGEAVRRAVREELSNELSNASAANGG